MQCHKCQSKDLIKNGHKNGKQKYKCKNCKAIITENPSWLVLTDSQKQLAQDMYAEGLGFRAIGRILGKSKTAISNFLKKNLKKPQLTMILE